MRRFLRRAASQVHPGAHPSDWAPLVCRGSGRRAEHDPILHDEADILQCVDILERIARDA